MKTRNLFSIALLFGVLLASAQESLKVDLSASSIKWTGYHLAKSYSHDGNISIKSGELMFNGDKLTGGSITIDMTSITNSDVEDEKQNAKLVGHLKSDDWFAVDKFPEATLAIKEVSQNGDKLNITGDITIRGITEPISFEASTTNQTASSVNYEAKLVVDRSKHEVLYGWSVENAVIDNNFELEINLVANK
jgi:polyisoprenoid-binding protein YceI